MPNPQVATAAILAAGAVATALILSTPSTAGPLDPPPGPVSETSPSLQQILTAVQTSSSQNCCCEKRWESHLINSANTTIPGDGVIRKFVNSINTTLNDRTAVFTTGNGNEFAVTPFGLLDTEVNIEFTGGITTTFSGAGSLSINVLVERFPSGVDQ